MIVPILQSGDSILRKRSKEVKQIDKKVSSLIRDLKDTLVAQKDPEGVGLAAPQIGKNFRIFVMRSDPKMEIKTIINPEIISSSPHNTPTKPKKANQKPKNKSIMEGCLSLPHYYTPLERQEEITIKFMDENGNINQESFEGLEAQIVQHEIDHLNGILFIDRMLEQGKKLYEFRKNRWVEIEI
jgi:peptide deformylase